MKKKKNSTKEKTNCSSTRTYLFSFYLFFISTINSPCFRPPEIKNFQFYSPLNNFLPLPPFFFDVITAEFYAPLLGTFISFSFSHSLRRVLSLSFFLSLSRFIYMYLEDFYIYIKIDLCIYAFFFSFHVG